MSHLDFSCIAGNLGEVSCREGPMMAGSDQFNITVNGKGGHGSTPQGTIDAIVSAAHLITALQTIPSRNLVRLIIIQLS